MRQSLLPLRPGPTPPHLDPDPQRGRSPQALQHSRRPTRPAPPTNRRLATLPARPCPVRQANRRAPGPGRSTGPDLDGGLAQAQNQKAIPLMDLAFIEYHPQRVLDAFRQGEFDALEILGQADERDFFERCFKERHRQLKCFYDLTHFRSRSLNAITAQVVMILLTYRLRQWQLWKFVEETLANLTPESLVQQLNLRQQWVVIYLGYAYTQMPLVTFTREVIQLEGPARDKALKKIQALEENLLTLPPNPRPS